MSEGRADGSGGHVFISYSREGDSAAYAKRLADHLTEHGLQVWYDVDIIPGDQWDTVIREKIATCRAMIVIMSRRAEESSWVSREIGEAEDLRKPIYPLLLSGRRFFRLNHLQYEDARGGKLPSDAFIERLNPFAVKHVSPPDQNGARKRTLRRIRSAVIAAAVLAVVVSIVIATLNGNQPSDPASHPTPTRSDLAKSPTPSPSPVANPVLIANQELFKDENLDQFAKGWLDLMETGCLRSSPASSSAEYANGLRTDVYCDFRDDQDRSIFLHFWRFAAPADARRYYQCSRGAGAPNAVEEQLVDLPGDTGSRSGMYCEYGYTGSDYLEVGIMWVDAVEPIAATVFVHGKANERDALLTYVRQLWTARA